MISGLPLAFLQPWLLAALVLLPAIWWLLRFTPPRPARIAFPPTRILLEIDPREETPARSPWWLVLLRMAAAAIVIVALAQPVLNPPPVTATGSGPLLVVIDNGWGAAPHWSRIAATADDALARAAGDARPAMLVATATDTAVAQPADAASLRQRLAGLSPAPHAPDRAALADAVVEAAAAYDAGEIVWFSDGLEHGDGDGFAARLAEAGIPARVVVPGDHELPLALAPPVNDAAGLVVEALRAAPGGETPGTLLAQDMRGRVVASTDLVFASGAATAQATFDLPVELRNEIVRVAIAGQPAAGSVQLLDDRWRRRTVGLAAGLDAERAQPLLSPLYYISRALGPYADLREAADANVAGAVGRLLDEGVATLVLADIGTLPAAARERLEEWVAEGGVLVRFAGPRLAGAEGNGAALLPTPLRSGQRMLGGTLSWSEPQTLAPFTSDSPFAHLELPGDVRVERQVLAEPAVDLAEKTWASLSDGTPLVTGSRVGRGWVVLFHVTADAAWSNLPLSGTFVEMLRRLVALSGSGGDSAGTAAGANGAEVLRPMNTLDAQGVLGPPAPGARPLEGARIASARPAAAHPPGLYGEPDAFHALNVIGSGDVHAALGPVALARTAYPEADPRSAGPWLLALALVLLVADGMAVLAMRGRGLRLRSRGISPAARAGAAALAILLLAPGHGIAQDRDAQAGQSVEDQFAMRATLETRLAYVRTGNRQIDETSRAGLRGLTAMLVRRTALEPASPIGVDVARDELAFFSFLYWPIDPEAEIPSDDVLARVDAYMKQGGTILFDTRDEIERRPSADGGATGPGMAHLRELLRGLDLPALEPVPAGHVLTKAFYLLQEFPGRWDGGQLWVESELREEDNAARPTSNADGVSSIMITSNDFAGAWAIDDSDRPLYPVSPGGDWQRELAYRVGINIMMYAMTGNYKADQVHVPALLERMGQ